MAEAFTAATYDTYGAYASLGLILNGVLTALLTPYVLRLMGVA